ncbi:ATP-binding protein [Paenibacillus sp. SGZ-1009]|uniref:ATP-binding protein n=1 Tax=Paenibacillus campi TaxID=3106031 RepID=UPI002B001740|nr:ATP-binding protein [Paenibacillus sp. SGZ-1009]
MLTVGSSVFVFSAVVERSGNDSLHYGRLAWRGFAPVLLISFACSIVIGWILTLYSAIDTQISLGVISFIVGVLYIGARRGLLLLLLGVAMYWLFTAEHNVPDLFIQTGLLLYPLAGWCAPSFQRASLRGKRMIVMLLILIGALIGIIMLLVEHRLQHMSSMWGLIVLIIVAGMIVGDYCVQAIERVIERKQTSRQMMELSNRVMLEAEKLRQLMNVAPMMITAIDANGCITAINDAALTQLRRAVPNLTREHISDVCLLEMKGSQLTEGMVGTLRMIERSRQSLTTTSEILRLDYAIVYMNVAPLFYEADGKLTGFVIVGQDVTEVEQLRSELNHVEQLSLVGKMAASITHEIRNPMAVVRGFLQLMKEKSPASLDHYYRIVMEELDRANSIINDFLSLAQNRIVEKEPGDLNAVIQELLPLLWADANLRGQSIVFRPYEALPQLYMNSREIKQLILNLVRNGMEAMDGSGEMTIETELVNEQVVMRITDTGPGISADRIDKLFEPFYTTKSKGTGLGLSLCLSIAERHHGRINVDSVEGKGTTFSVIFEQVDVQVQTVNRLAKKQS